METTYYFISFYCSESRELFPIETRKMVCYSGYYEPSILRVECRKYCRQLFRRGFGCKSSDVVYRLSIVSERQYNESVYSLL